MTVYISRACCCCCPSTYLEYQKAVNNYAVIFDDISISRVHHYEHFFDVLVIVISHKRTFVKSANSQIFLGLPIIRNSEIFDIHVQDLSTN